MQPTATPGELESAIVNRADAERPHPHATPCRQKPLQEPDSRLFQLQAALSGHVNAMFMALHAYMFGERSGGVWQSCALPSTL